MLRKPLIPIIVVTLFIVASGGLFFTLQSELVPAEDSGIVQVNVNAPEGTGFAEMSRYMGEVQARLLPLIDESGPVRNIVTRTPGGFGASDDFNSGAGTIFLRPWEERTATTASVVGEVNRAIGQVAAVRGNASVRSSLSRGRGNPVNFVIAGATYPELVAARVRILAAARDNPGLVNVDSDYKENKPQLNVEVDTARAGDLGVSVADVSNALQTLLGSRRVSTYVDRGEEYRVVVQAEEESRRQRTNLAQSMCAGAPARCCRCRTWCVRATRRARETSAAITSCARSRLPPVSRRAIRWARRWPFSKPRRRARRRSPRSAIAARARRSARPAARSTGLRAHHPRRLPPGAQFEALSIPAIIATGRSPSPGA